MGSMKMTQYLLKVIGVVSLVISFSVGSFVPVVSARGIKIPSASQIAAEMESRYHMNLGSIQDQSESFNVASQKKSVPEVSLSFSPSDPKPGEKITANALPSFFSNEVSALYFTWYLQRKDCDADNSPSSDIRTKCDNDGNGRITANDWKIEAMRTLATSGFDNASTSYGSGDDKDDDGYKARFGGDNRVGTNDYCAIHDSSTGTIYELVQGMSDMSGICGSGLSPACIGTSTAESVDPSNFTGSGGSAYSVSDGASVYFFAGYPQCSGGAATCNSGSLRCVVDPKDGSDFGSSPVSGVCTGANGIPASDCTHLFPKAIGFTAGDANFGVDEERFWHTDPNDPSTAQNGNKDEANVVGLGQNNFTWSYDSGDKVGVVVEGTSMITTKHDDSSSYVMWGFSKNNCPISSATGTGSYVQTIRGYGVSIPAATVNLNDCLEKNLVDPTEGGQPGRMEVSVTADPESPVNDASGDLSGDRVTASATVSNSTTGSGGQVFDWKVSIANNVQFDNSGNRHASDITDELKTQKLLGMTRGNGLSQLSVLMNMPADFLSRYTDANGVGYMRFSVNVSENFSSGIARKGRGDVIVKFQTIEDRIGAYRVNATGDPLKLALVSGVKSGEICDETASLRTVCPVAKNEIIGLRLGSAGFTDYSWTVNGKPLVCTNTLSDQCSDDVATKINFLPVFGETGDIFTVGITAVDVVSGKKATLSRIFRIVDPTVAIVSADTNKTWPKFLGQYKDVSGNLYNDLSLNIFQAFSGDKLRLKAVFIPSFLQDGAMAEWSIDGETMMENADGEIELPIGKGVGDIYNISYGASVIQSPEIRKALQQFWNISVFDSGESVFSKSIQVEVMGSEDTPATVGFFPGSKKFAALASYIPASVLFTVKAFFSMMLILLLSGFMMSLAPETHPRRSRE